MLTQDNWIEFSFDGRIQRDHKENLRIDIKNTARQLIGFDQACDLAAGEIYETHRDLYLGMSGGADSEYVAECLWRNGIPFTPVILECPTLLHNDMKYEAWFAKHWCGQHGMEPIVIDIESWIGSPEEIASYQLLKPRLYGGAIQAAFLKSFVEARGGKLLSGFQMEYYPDQEQMTYLEPQLKDYHGFVIEESDIYIESLAPDQHPWAFYYWSPEIMVAFAHEWDISLTMTQNKSKIYKTNPRPKFSHAMDMLPLVQMKIRTRLGNSWGTQDCAVMGSRQDLISRLLP